MAFLSEDLLQRIGLKKLGKNVLISDHPLACFATLLLFGGAAALGPALQSVGITANYYLYGAAPYALTLALLVWSSSTRHTLAGAPSELGISK